MDLNLIIAVLIIVLGLVSVLLGIIVAGRFSGKLRLSVIFLTLAAAIILLVRGIGSITSLAIFNTEVIRSIENIGVILFIFLTILTLKLTIDKLA